MKKISENENGLFEAFLSRTWRMHPEEPEDYKGEDGRLYCGVCHTPKSSRLELLGKWYDVPIACKCRQEQIRREEKEAEWYQTRSIIEDLCSDFKIPENLRNACFENYEHRQGNAEAFQVAYNYVKHFDEMYKTGQGLLFYGAATGIGKSWTAACILNALLAKNIPAAITSLNDIIKKIQDRTDTEESVYRLFRKAKLLIFDDLGAERSTDFALEKVYNAVNERIQSCKPLILTTNLTLNELKAPQDIRYKRIYDRILGVCIPVHVSGFSFRLEEGRKRRLAMQALLTEDAEQ